MKYDLIIIGAGPGGYLAAMRAKQRGFKKVMIVEQQWWGGVCLNVGCIPTKALLKCSKVYNFITHASSYGIEVPKKVASIDWTKMQSRKAVVVGKLSGAVKFLMKKYKVDVVEGKAAAKDQHTIIVKDKEYEFEKLLLATGSEPRHLPLDGFAEARKAGFLLDSTSMLALKNLPKSMITIGGGVIGLEFSFMMAELGVEVTILQGLDTILEILDQDISKEMTKIALENKKIKIITNALVKGAKDKSILYQKDGKDCSIKADICLEAVGRVPTSEGFDNIGITRGKINSIVVNEKMQTNLSHIYAIGDVIGISMLAHTAYKEAKVAIDNMVGIETTIDYEQIPNCIYTSPEVASVGLTEAQAKTKEIDYKTAILPLGVSGKAIADGATDGFMKLIIEKKYGAIIGAHIICPTATDMISDVTTLMATEGTITEFANVVRPHPTYNELLTDVGEGLEGIGH